MTFDDYENEIEPTALYSDGLVYTVLGLNDESGEVAGALKKYMRGDYDKQEMRLRLIGELGDVLWYLSRTAHEIGVPLSEVAELNVKKVLDRLENGTINGDGDYR